MTKAAAAHDALRRVVVIRHAVDGVEKRVAVGGARACRGDEGGGFLADARDAFCIGGVGRQPADRLGARLAGQPRLQAGLRAQRSEDVAAGEWIIARAGEVAHPQAVGLAFLVARKAERIQPAAGPGDLPDDVRAGNRAEQRRAEADEPGALLALLRVAGGDMADFMAHHERQLGFVVHQRHELAGDIDIAAGDGEGIVGVGIEQGDGVIARPCRQPRLHGDTLPDAAHIGRLRAIIGAAELRDELRVRLGAFGTVARRQAGGILGNTAAPIKGTNNRGASRNRE